MPWLLEFNQPQDVLAAGGRGAPSTLWLCPVRGVYTVGRSRMQWLNLQVGRFLSPFVLPPTHSANNVTLQSTTVSRKHARILMLQPQVATASSDKRPHLIDVSSTVSTKVNDKAAARDEAQPTLLEHGDTIMFAVVRASVRHVPMCLCTSNLPPQRVNEVRRVAETMGSLLLPCLRNYISLLNLVSHRRSLTQEFHSARRGRWNARIFSWMN